MLEVHLWRADICPALPDLLLECESLWQYISRVNLRPPPPRLPWYLLKCEFQDPHQTSFRKTEFPGMEPWNLYFFRLPLRFFYKLKFKNYCSSEWRTVAGRGSFSSLQSGWRADLLLRPFKNVLSGDSLPSRYIGLEAIWVLDLRVPRKLSYQPQASKNRGFGQDCFLCAQAWSSYKIRYS